MTIEIILSILAIVISIFTFIFTVLIDLKSYLQSLIKQKYLNKISNIYLDKILLLCYIRLEDDNNFKLNFDKEIGLFKLKEAFFIEKLTKLIEDMKNIQSKKIILSMKLEREIELLNIILNISHSYLKIISLDEIIYKGTTAYNSEKVLKLLFEEIKDFKCIKNNKSIKSIRI